MTERLNDKKNSAFQHKLFSTQAQRVLDLMNLGRLSSYFFSGVNKSYSCTDFFLLKLILKLKYQGMICKIPVE